MTVGEVRHAGPVVPGQGGRPIADAGDATVGDPLLASLGPWQITRTLGRDLGGTYYAGCRDDGAQATLYLLAEDRAAAGDAALGRLLALHGAVAHAGLVCFRELQRDGSDRYLIADRVDDALVALRAGERPATAQVRELGAALAEALAVAHEHDLIHGGLTLDNVLWAPDRSPRILGAGVASAGLPDRAALARGDVAALGRLLWGLVAGWRARGQDDIYRRLADPSEPISMHQAHAMLAEGEPTQMLRVIAAPATSLATAEAAASVAPAGDPATPGASPSVGAVADLGRGATEPTGEPGPARGTLGGLVGRYRILTRLGRGGMGEVFLAEDPVLRRGVAIKRLRPDLDHDRTFRARLRREARLAAHLGHRAIVQVFDLVTDDGADHLVMEYVSGPSLHTLAGASRPPLAEVVRIATEITDGLAFAHQHGVIHRDLKLENILVGADQQPKIADFGLACYVAAAAGGADEALTEHGVSMGTSRSMSPEQAQGAEVDARSDLFSLGVMLYELVTGTSPFASGHRAQTLLRVVQYRPPPVRDLVPEVPPPLCDLIAELLDKDPAQRPASALVVRDRLRQLDASLAPGAGESWPRGSATYPIEAEPLLDSSATRHDRPAPALPDEHATARLLQVPARSRAIAAPPVALPSAAAPSVALPPVAAPSVAAPSDAVPTVAAPAEAAVAATGDAAAETRQLPNLRAMAIAFVASLSVGFLQAVISWMAGIALNDRAQPPAPRIFIGYLSSYHWWVSYMMVVPVAVASALPIARAFGELGTRRARFVGIAGAGAAFTTGAVFIVAPILKAIHGTPAMVCQWNYLACRPASGSYSPELRVVLMVLGYLHELTGFTGLMFAVLGVLALAWLVREPRAVATRDRVRALLLNQRLSMLAGLIYLVLLRSSKVNIHLTVTGQSPDQVFGRFLHWGSYFQIIDGGTALNLLLGGLWITATFASHLLVAYANLRPTLSDDAHGVWLVISHAVRFAGRPFLLALLGAAVLIALPPPGWVPLLAVMVVIAALAGLSRPLRTVDPPASS